MTESPTLAPAGVGFFVLTVYRSLKEEARPVSQPTNAGRVNGLRPADWARVPTGKQWSGGEHYRIRNSEWTVREFHPCGVNHAIHDLRFRRSETMRQLRERDGRLSRLV
jgi:hypothetical protein